MRMILRYLPQRQVNHLPDGAVLVTELFAAQKDAEGDIVLCALGRRVPASMKAVVIVERRSGWDDQYAGELKVGDWEFEVFSPSGENLGKNTNGCRECHHPLSDSDYLFSLEHLATLQD